MIRDINKIPSLPTRNLSNSVIAHFRPHMHPISCLTFNQSGTLLLSASKQGHTFHVFSILSNTTATGNVSHLYKLSRGFTDAQVEDCQFSIDSNWCAISTARGTTHVYAINPYGGKPEISGHVHSKINNSIIYHKKMKPKPMTTSLNSIVRIKQRRRMPEINQEDFCINNYYGPTPPRYHPVLPQQLPMQPQPQPCLNRLQKESRPKLITLFVNSSKLPFLNNEDNHSTQQQQQQTSTNNILKHIPYYLPQQPQNHHQSQQPQQHHQQQSDTLVFGFDEEYDDAAKMMNDEVGYQDIYTFHPDGVLTLFRCWVTKVAVKKRENGRNMEKLDLSLKKESVAEWKVARSSDWEQVKTVIHHNEPKRKDKELAWLSNAEINTYPIDEPPIWTHRQFVFQTYNETTDVQVYFKTGTIPPVDTLIMPKEMPEPISSRIDRVRKTTTTITEENMEHALAELEDNLSKAMLTSFSPSESINNSPANKWLSTSANSPSSKLFANEKKSVSFEDAHFVNMGSGPSPEPSMHGSTPMQHSSLIQLDDNNSLLEDDEYNVRFESDNNINQIQNHVFSPDGDNEVAYPYESIFDGFREPESFHWQ